MMRYNILASLTLAALMLSAISAHAETEQTSDSIQVLDMEEIVVRPQHKEQAPLRRLPLASTSFHSSEMHALGVRDLHDIASFTPSFSMPSYGSRYTSTIYVRGTGARINSPAVTMYLDGIPLVSKSQMNMHTYAMERVELLRGPQGTLYGMNSEGGLLHISSYDPFVHQGTEISASVGTHLYRNAEASTYHRLSDRFALSAAAFYEGCNGFFKNETTGSRADKSNEAGGRVRLAWKPNGNLRFDLTSDAQWVDQNAFPYGTLDLASGRAALPATNIDGHYRRTMVTTGLNIRFMAPRVELLSTTSHQFLDDDMLMDIDYLPNDDLRMKQQQKMNAITEELVLKSKGDVRWQWTTGAFGAYQWLRTDAPVFFDEGFNSRISQTIQDAAYYGMLGSMAARMGEAVAAQKIEDAGGVHIRMEMGDVPGLFRTPQANAGIFHESAIRLFDRLTATLGLRYDYSSVAIDYKTSALADLQMDVIGVKVHATSSSALDRKETAHYHQLLPKIGLTFEVDDRHSNIYATVAKGYRSGGFNIQMFSDILRNEVDDPRLRAARSDVDFVVDHTEADYERIRETISYKPEESWNYEVGTHLNLADGLLQADAAFFWMQIRNQQLSVMAPGGFGRMMENAGRTNSRGAELSLRGSSRNNRLTWAASYALTCATFSQYKDSITSSSATPTGKIGIISYAGNHVPFIPTHTASASLDYRFDFSGSLRSITLGANATVTGKTYWDEANSFYQKAYALLGAHVSADFGTLSLNLWGRNLTNTHYNTFALYNTSTATPFAQRGAPIQFGIDLRVKF
ncbi:MAG: TonB-dependent receptor [Bacteroidaceae bacterium]|nr:TonB-dependent receptor [Bacteroidaceae bacterium]